jgi:hypothetical protein
MIKASLDAIDQHNDHYLKTNNYKHLVAAYYLRQYVTYVKDLIIELEGDRSSQGTTEDEQETISL